MDKIFVTLVISKLSSLMTAFVGLSIVSKKSRNSCTRWMSNAAEYQDDQEQNLVEQS